MAERETMPIEGGGVSQETRADRYHAQLKEGAEVIEESASILKSVAEKLERAAARLQQYGAAPLQDLERR